MKWDAFVAWHRRDTKCKAVQGARCWCAKCILYKNTSVNFEQRHMYAHSLFPTNRMPVHGGQISYIRVVVVRREGSLADP